MKEQSLPTRNDQKGKVKKGEKTVGEGRRLIRRKPFPDPTVKRKIQSG